MNRIVRLNQNKQAVRFRRAKSTIPAVIRTIMCEYFSLKCRNTRIYFFASFYTCAHFIRPVLTQCTELADYYQRISEYRIRCGVQNNRNI